MLFDFLRGRGPRSSRAPEVERVAPGTWRIELVGDPPVLVESGPVPPRRTGYVPAGQDLSAFLLRAGDARGEVAAVLTVGPSKSLGDHVSHLRHGHAAWRVLEMNGLLGFLAPGRFEPPGAARGPLFGALARAAAALAAEHGAATVVAARDLGAAPFSSQPETMRESTEAEARLDEAFARAGSGVIHPEPHHPAGTEPKSYHPRYAGRVTHTGTGILAAARLDAVA